MDLKPIIEVITNKFLEFFQEDKKEQVCDIVPVFMKSTDKILIFNINVCSKTNPEAYFLKVKEELRELNKEYSILLIPANRTSMEKLND